MIKWLENFEKMADFYKLFCPFFWKSLRIHLNPLKNVFSVLLPAITCSNVTIETLEQAHTLL